MTIAEFAESRGVDRQAVQKYIKRHPEIKDCTTMDGRTIILTDEVVKMLDKIYPVPKPVTVVQGVPREEYEELLRRYAVAQEQIAAIQTARVEEQKQLSELSARSILLEDKSKQLADAETRIEQLQAEVNRLQSRSLLERILNK